MHRTAQSVDLQLGTSTEPLSVDEALKGDFLRLVRSVCLDVQGAAITFGAILRFARKPQGYSTFAKAELLQKYTGLSAITVRRHLKQLEKNKWLVKDWDRHRRRTCTYKIPDDRLNELDSFDMLPCWAVSSFTCWAERRLFAAIVSRYYLCLFIDEGQDYGNSDGREELSLSYLEHRTGLSRPSLIKAKHFLRERGLIKINIHEDEDGYRYWGDYLELDLEKCCYEAAVEQNLGLRIHKQSSIPRHRQARPRSLSNASTTTRTLAGSSANGAGA